MARADAGDLAGARRDAEEALAWAREADVPGVVVLGLAFLAAADAALRPAARAALESNAERTALFARLEAAVLLGDAARARVDLARLLEGAPAAARTPLAARAEELSRRASSPR
jgi:hypothetical protein